MQQHSSNFVPKMVALAYSGGLDNCCIIPGQKVVANRARRMALSEVGVNS